MKIGWVVGEALLADRFRFAPSPHFGKRDCRLPCCSKPKRIELPGAFECGELGVELTCGSKRRAKGDQILRTVRIQLDRAPQMEKRIRRPIGQDSAEGGVPVGEIGRQLK